MDAKIRYPFLNENKNMLKSLKYPNERKKALYLQKKDEKHICLT